MKSRLTTWKSIALTFVFAVVFYVLAYSWMSKKQTAKGAWEVKFSTNVPGVPEIVVAEPALGISNVTVRFEGEQLATTNTTSVVFFNKPKMPTPFGRVIYDDLMFQPGSVAVDCFGHVVEMVPRQLILNSAPHGWSNGAVFSLFPTNKLSSEVRKKWKGGYR